MCSKVSRPGEGQAAPANVTAELARAIDEYAAAARHPGTAAETDLAARLAALWAILTDADPELAACTARYAAS
jgi:hypothetical protein